MATTTSLMTAEELLALPDDGIYRELIRGELREYPMSGVGAQCPPWSGDLSGDEQPGLLARLMVAATAPAAEEIVYR